MANHYWLVYIHFLAKYKSTDYLLFVFHVILTNTKGISFDPANLSPLWLHKTDEYMAGYWEESVVLYNAGNSELMS